MKSQIFGHWDVCCMNSAHYRKFFFFKLFHPLPQLFDLMNSCLDFSSLRPPFTAYNQKELAEKIREGKFRRIPFRYSEELNSLISRMLNLKV